MNPADIIEIGLARAGTAPDHVSTSVIVVDSSTVNLRLACNTLTTNGTSTQRTVSVITAVRGPAGIGVASLTRTSDGSAIVQLIDSALAQARKAPAAEDARELPPGSVDADFTDPAVEIGPDALATTAEQAGAALDAFRTAGQELFGYAFACSTTSWLGTSAGARRRHVQPRGTVDLTGKSHGRTRSSFANATTPNLADVDLVALAAQLSIRLGWQARTLDVTPGRHDTLLPASSVADLLVCAYWSADARSAAEGRSVFSRSGSVDQPSARTRLGETLSASPLTLFSDPGYPGIECCPFSMTAASGPTASVFDNGLDLRPSTWIDDGTLTALPASRYSAELAGLAPHPEVDNLVLRLDGATGTLDDLIAGTDHGLLVTSLWYIREVDPVTLLLTGLTRDGVYVVDGGEVVGATSNFRFNDSPVDLLARVEAGTGTEAALSREWSDYFTLSAMPALRVSGLNLSTRSQGT